MDARERYIQEGPAGLGGVELLALVLGAGPHGRSGQRIATDLLDRFGGPRGLATAEPSELARVPGVGPARAVRIHAALAFARQEAPPLPDAIRCVADAVAVLTPGLRGLPHEELHALYLDRRHRPVGRRILTRGSDAFTVVDPRQVFRPAIRLSASAVLLAHNHPSGDARPSRQDLDVSRRVDAAGRVIGVRLLDHLVIGETDVQSIAALGVLAGWRDGPITTGTG